MRESRALDYEKYMHDLEIFASNDEGPAGEAFERLWKRVEDRLTNYVRRLYVNHVDREDLVSDVQVKALKNRLTFKPRDPIAWWGYLTKIANNHYIDECRKRRVPVIAWIKDAGEIPDKERGVLNLLITEQDVHKLYAYADRLWLGVHVDRSESRYRLLIAQYYYLEQMQAKEILEMHRDLTPGDLDELLTDPSILRQLAYQELYWPNDKLAALVARPENPCTLKELEDLRKRAYRERSDLLVNGWSSAEFLVVMWRIRNGLLVSSILASELHDFSQEALEHILDRCRAHFPFEAIARHLVQHYHDKGIRDLLVDDRLLRRVVFQCCLSDELPHKQIVERYGVAAEVLGNELTEKTLHSWLSVGNLLKQFIRFVKMEEGYAA